MKSSFSRISFIKIPRHKRFEFTPRHFDEEKERLEKRKKEIAQDLGLSGDDERSRREINFRAKLKGNRVETYRSSAALLSNIRLVVILGILLVICYFIYTNLDKMMATLTA